jgi:hypothetical protein
MSSFLVAGPRVSRRSSESPPPTEPAGRGSFRGVRRTCRSARARVFSHVKQVCYLGLRGAREGGIDGGPWPDRPAASQ